MYCLPPADWKRKLSNAHFWKGCQSNQPISEALFIPTAANTPDAIEVLPKCLNDLLKCGIPRENITVYDLYDALDGPAYKRMM